MVHYSSIVQNKCITHIAACLIAYTLWSLWSDRILVHATYPFTVHIKTHASQVIQQAPKQITVTLRGLRQALRSLDTSQLAVYIPQDVLKNEIETITLKPEYFTLPARIQVVRYAPSNFTVHTRILKDIP